MKDPRLAFGTRLWFWSTMSLVPLYIFAFLAENTLVAILSNVALIFSISYDDADRPFRYLFRYYLKAHGTKVSVLIRSDSVWKQNRDAALQKLIPTARFISFAPVGTILCGQVLAEAWFATPSDAIAFKLGAPEDVFNFDIDSVE